MNFIIKHYKRHFCNSNTPHFNINLKNLNITNSILTKPKQTSIFPPKIIEDYLLEEKPQKQKPEKKLFTEIAQSREVDYQAMSEAINKSTPLIYLLNYLQPTLMTYSYEKKQKLIILRFINFILNEYSNALEELIILDSTVHILKIMGRAAFYEKDQTINLDIHYELILLKDKAEMLDKEHKIVGLLDKYMSLNKTFFIALNRILRYIIECNKLTEFYKYIYILARLSANNIQSILTESNFKSLSDFVKTNLKESINKFTPEKIIILITCLNKLELIDKSVLRELDIENFSLEQFHIYLEILKADNSAVTFNNYENNMLHFIFYKFLKNTNDMTALVPMRNTVDYIFKICYSGIAFQNFNGIKQKKLSAIINLFFSKLTSTINTINVASDLNADFLIWTAYIFSAYSAKPTHIFNLIIKKELDILKVNPEILLKFIAAVESRLKYSYQFDHELFLLKRLRKHTYIPYDSSLDKIIIKITQQIQNELAGNVNIQHEHLIAVLKTLNIIFYNDINDSNYKLPKIAIDTCQTLFNKCIVKGGKYLKQVLENDEVLMNLIAILPYIQFYTDKSQATIEDFLLYLVSRKQNTQNLRFYLNISEYVNFELLKGGRQHSKAFIDIYKKLADNILAVLVNEKKITNSSSNNLEHREFIKLLINTYNILLIRNDLYQENIKLFNNYFNEVYGLRVLASYDLLKLRNDALNENTLVQVISNFQTIQIANKNNILSQIITTKSIKDYLLSTINVLKTISSLENFNMSAFSYLTGTIFEEFSHQEITDILKVLSNNKEHNYHPLFEKKLLARYTNRELLFSLKKKDESVFFNLALYWPFFIQNEELVRCLLHSHESKLLQQDRYEIVDLLTYNMIMHNKLMSFFGNSIGKIKNIQNRKNIFCNYLNNCTYIGYNMELSLYEVMLSLYEELFNAGQKFNLDEMIDLAIVSYISDIQPSKLSTLVRTIYEQLIERIKMSLDLNITFHYKGTNISFYPSIVSEDRIFHKSLVNSYINNEYEDELADEEEAIGDAEAAESHGKSYMRKSRDSSFNEDKAFEDYFEKKRQLIYGHEANLMDSIITRNTLKRYCITKILGLNIDDSFTKEVYHILNEIHESKRDSEIYQKLYVKFIAESFTHKYKILTKYKDEYSGILVDFAINYKGKTMYVLYISDKNISKDHLSNSIEKDGLYKLISKTLERDNIKVVYLYESSLKESQDNEFKKLITENLENN
jgi:hypothetical protein